MEDTRKLIHVGMMRFALLLRWLNWWQAALCAIAAVCINIFIMPRIGKAAFREEDLERGYARGMVYYSISVLILILTMPLPIAAAAWGIMACGDGFASVVGMRWGTRKWIWNENKSYLGSLAFWVAGTSAATFLFMFTQGNIMASMPLYFNGGHPWSYLTAIPPSWVLLACALATGVSTLLESLPISLDDNLSVPLSAGGALLFLVWIMTWYTYIHSIDHLGLS